MTTFRLRVIDTPTPDQWWIQMHQVNPDGTTTPRAAVLEYQAKAGDYVWWQTVEVVLP